MTKLWIIILIIFIHWIDTIGCDCEDGSNYRNWKNNELIFKAEVIYKSPRLIYTNLSKLYYTDLLIVDVFKGDLIHKGDTLSIIDFGSTCDYQFDNHKEYLVFTNPYLIQGISQCSGTIPWKSDERLLVIDSVNYYNKNFIDTIGNEIILNVINFPKFKLQAAEDSNGGHDKYLIVLILISFILNIVFVFLLIKKVKRPTGGK